MPANPQKRAAEGRRLKVAELILAHRSIPQMAAELCVGLATIHRDCEAVRAEWLTKRQALAEQHAAEQLARLEALERAIWTKALRGDLRAIDRALAIYERRAKLLGLDAPVQINLYHYVLQMAQAAGLDEHEALAEAERILSASRR